MQSGILNRESRTMNNRSNHIYWQMIGLQNLRLRIITPEPKKGPIHLHAYHSIRIFREPC